MCAYCEVLDPARQGQDKVLHGQIDVSCPVRGDRLVTLHQFVQL